MRHGTMPRSGVQGDFLKTARFTFFLAAQVSNETYRIEAHSKAKTVPFRLA